jgi:hypothetical protein
MLSTFLEKEWDQGCQLRMKNIEAQFTCWAGVAMREETALSTERNDVFILLFQLRLTRGSHRGHAGRRRRLQFARASHVRNGKGKGCGCSSSASEGNEAAAASVGNVWFTYKQTGTRACSLVNSDVHARELGCGGLVD